MASKKNTSSWSDVKAKLADFDRAELLGLVQDLYAASKDNQSFLHARFGLGDDVLKPYKATIATLPDGLRTELWARLDGVRQISHNLGHGVGENMDDLLAEYGADV